MHSTLTGHARCLYGDAYAPTPECDRDHREFLFVERLTFTDADEIHAKMRALCPHVVDGYLPVWIRNLAYRLLLPQRPDEPALLREAAENPWPHGPDRDGIAADLTARADALDAGPSRSES